MAAIILAAGAGLAAAAGGMAGAMAGLPSALKPKIAWCTWDHVGLGAVPNVKNCARAAPRLHQPMVRVGAPCRT